MKKLVRRVVTEGVFGVAGAAWSLAGEPPLGTGPSLLALVTRPALLLPLTPPEANRLVSPPVAGEIDSARVCRVDSELEWQPHAAIAVHSGATTNNRRIRAESAVIEEKRGMGRGALEESVDSSLAPGPLPLIPGCRIA